MDLRPAPSRRKSSNLLASLARQNTLSERDKDGHLEGISETGSLYSAGSRGMGIGDGLASSAASVSGISMVSTGPSISGSSMTSGSIAPSSQNTPSSSSQFGAALENLRYLLGKRLTTFNYLKRAHEGKVHWFNTILLHKEELEAVFDNAKMAKRTTRWAILGMSLSMLLEITAAHDFLRGLLSLLSEFDTITDENIRVKTKNLFKPGKGKRPSGTAEYPMSVQESGDLSYFFSPNIPFELDYFQVFFTLCDILVEVYQKILSFLGPVSKTGQYSNLTQVGPTALNASTRSGVGLSQMLVEVVLKIDHKLKKIITMVTKELDTVARGAIKEELSFINDTCLGGTAGLSNEYF